MYSHATKFREFDPPWNPAHLTLYAGIALAIVPSLLALRCGLKLTGPERVRLLGIKIILLGGLAEIAGGMWNEIYHHFFSSEPPLSPAHSLLTVGMITVNLGLLLGVSIEYGVTQEFGNSMDRVLYVALLCLFASMWLVSSGSTMYFARIWRDMPSRFWILLGVAFIFPLIMVSAGRVLKRPGSLFIIAGIYALVNYYFLVIYVGVPAYAPLTLVSGALVDAAYWGARRLVDPFSATLATGLVGGSSTFLAYYPFSQYLLLLQSPPLLDGRFLAYTAAGVLGAISAHLLVESVSASIRGKAQFPTP